MTRFLKLPWLDYDDVLLVPQYSTLKSRSEVDTSTVISVNRANEKCPELKLSLPVISANMDTVTGFHMAKEMGRLGGAGIIHRYMSTDDMIALIVRLQGEKVFPIIPSLGVKEDDFKAAGIYADLDVDAVCVDIAHGDSINSIEFIKKLREKFSQLHIIAGNIATAGAYLRLYNAGANSVKVGISNGSVCSTRPTTGVGVPSLTTLRELINVVSDECPIIADGGFTKSGDIVKALAAGASAIMSGYFFAGTDEAAQPSKYRGMASDAAQAEWKGWSKHVEGCEITVSPKGPVREIVEQLKDGITSGMSYCNATNIRQLWENAEFITRRSAV